jgi:uncharacterized protein Usg
VFQSKVFLLTRITYSLPDYPHLVNDFVWQFEDIAPELLGFNTFIDYWQKHIEAEIRCIEVSQSQPHSFFNADIIYNA